MTTIHTNYTNSAYTKAAQYEKAAEPSPAVIVLPEPAESEEPAAVYVPSMEERTHGRGVQRMEVKPAPGYNSVQEMIAEYHVKNPKAGNLGEPGIKTPAYQMELNWPGASKGNDVFIKEDGTREYSFVGNSYFTNAFQYLRDPGDDENYARHFVEFWNSLNSASSEAKAMYAAGQEVDRSALTVKMHGVEMSFEELDKIQDTLKGMVDNSWMYSSADVEQRLLEAGVSEEATGLAVNAYQLRMDNGVYGNQPSEVPKYKGGITSVWLWENLEQYYEEPQSSNTYFYEQAFEFFRTPGDEESYWDNYAAFTSSLDIARQELTDQIAAGKGDSLDTLTAKVKIAPDMEMTLAEIQSVYEVYKGVTNKVTERFKQSIQGEEFTAFHMMAAMSVRRGLADAGLSQEIADFAADIYQNRTVKYIENVEKVGSSRMKKMTFDPAVHTGNQYYEYYFAQTNYDIHDENSIDHDVYERLINIDVSNDEALEKGLSDLYQWYYGQMEILTQLHPQMGTAPYRSAFLLEFKDLFF